MLAAMSGTEGERTTGSGATWGIGSFGALILYFLLPVPVAKVLTAIYGANVPTGITKAFMIIYWPVRLLSEHFEMVRDFYTWYGRIWGIR